MATSDPHTVRAFDDELQQIRALVAEIGGLTEVAIEDALKALIQGDDAGAAKVVADDAKINQLADEIERQCIRLIALRAPMADDLREILAAFKISVLLERMGDCARNIAEQVPKSHGFARQRQLGILRRMLAAVAEMVRSALDAFVGRDPLVCERVCSSDHMVDDLHDELFRDLQETMEESAGNVGGGTCLLLASLKLERIGDHAANIARVVYYSVTGDQMSRQGRSRPITSAAA